MSDSRQFPSSFYDAPNLAALPHANAESMPQPTLAQQWTAAETIGKADLPTADLERMHDSWAPVIDTLNQGRPFLRRYHNPGEGGPRGGIYITDENGMPALSAPPPEELQERAWAGVVAMRQRNPNAFPDLPATLDEFRGQDVAREKARLAEARATVARSNGLLAGATQLTAGIVTSFRNPVNIAGMALGAGGTTVLGRIGLAAAGNAGVTAIDQPLIASSRAQIGEKLTTTEMVGNVAEAALGGGAIQGLGEVAAPVVGKIGMAISTKLGWGELTDAERAVLHETARETDIAATSPNGPGAGTERHVAKVAEATAALLRTPTEVADAGRVPRETARSVPQLTQDDIVRFTQRDLEGGATVVHYGSVDGGTTKYGIAAKHNPGVDVANLTEAQAAAIAKQKYWTPDLNGIDPRLAAVAFDGGYIGGPGLRRKILREAGGDVEEALAVYRAALNDLADSNPAKARYKKGWNARVDKLAAHLDGVAEHGAPIIGPDDGVQLADSALSDAEAAAAAARGEPAPGGGPIAIEGPLREPIGAGELTAQDGFAFAEEAPVQARSQPQDATSADAAMTFETEKGSTYRVEEHGGTTRDKAYRPEHGEAEQGPQPTSQATHYVSAEDAVKLGEFQAQGDPRVAIHELPDGRIGVRYLEGKDAGKFEARTVVRPEPGPAVGLTPVETWRNGARVHFGNKISKVERAPRAAPVPRETMASVPRAEIARFDDPIAGAGPRLVADSLTHDAQQLLEANPDAAVRLSGGVGKDDTQPPALADVLKDLADDDAAIAAARGCM